MTNQYKNICDDVRELLVGAYDLHIHPIPSHVERLMDDEEVLEQAERAGMAGVLLKNHYEPTGARAILANRLNPEFKAKAYGAVVLNWPVGGLNPYAVHSALKMGAKIVFMPTRDATNSLTFGNMPGDFFDRPGISLQTPEGTLRPEVFDIFDVVKSYGAFLATGHISPSESSLLCREGRRQGVNMILTHPEWDRTVMSGAEQAELAHLGVYIEKCWLNVAENLCSAQEMSAHIREVGTEHCFLSTDRGQADREPPVEGMTRFITILLQEGFSKSEIAQMVRKTPAEILQS